MLLGTLYAVLILSVVLVLGNLFKEIRPLLVDQVAPLGMVGRFILYVLPASLMFTMPWGFLTAVLLVFGRLSSDQEITAFRVSGMSLWRLSVPVFVIAAVLSGACLYLNINVVPQATEGRKNLLYDQARKDPASMLDPGLAQAKLQGDKKLFIERREGGTLVGFHMYILSEPKKGALKPGVEEETGRSYLHAGRATFVVDDDKKQFRFRLKDAFMETQKAGGPGQPAFAAQVEPVLADFKSSRARANPGSMTNGEIADYLKGNPELSPKKQLEFRTESIKRYSFSMACLAFAFVAVPLGLKSRRKDTSMNLIISLLLGAGYFLFSVVSSEFKTDLGAAAVLWLPNVLCVGVGLVLFRRARFK